MHFLLYVKLLLLLSVASSLLAEKSLGKKKPGTVANRDPKNAFPPLLLHRHQQEAHQSQQSQQAQRSDTAATESNQIGDVENIGDDSMISESGVAGAMSRRLRGGEDSPVDEGTDQGGSSESEETVGEEKEIIEKWKRGPANVVEFFDGKKERLLCVDNFLFYKAREGSTERINEAEKISATLYRCQMAQNGCKKQVWMQGDQYIKETAVEHDHFADPIDVGERRIVAKAFELLREHPRKSLDDVFTEIFAGVSDTLSRQVDRENLRRKLAKFKETQLKYPPGPTTPARLVIPEDWTKFTETTGTDGEKFVIYDGFVNEERLIVMTSDFMLETLAKSNVAAGDGTFEMRFAPKAKWAQLYLFHAYVDRPVKIGRGPADKDQIIREGTFVPAVAFASSKRTASVYRKALQVIREEIQNRYGVNWAPKLFLTDFEMAVKNAVEEIFVNPTTRELRVQHLSCYFHYAQALMNRVKQLKLKDLYNNDIAFNEFVRLVKVLALVPFESLHECLPIVADQLRQLLRSEDYNNIEKESMRAFYEDYFLPNYIGTETRQARFSPAWWNHNRLIEGGLDELELLSHPKTTNALESFHKSLNAVGERHGRARFWGIYTIIQEQLDKSQLASPRAVICGLMCHLGVIFRD